MGTRGKRATLVALVVLSAATAGCAHSNYQTAKMLPPGGAQIGAAINSYGYHADDGSADTEGFEAMGSYGITDTFELGGKFSYMGEMDLDAFNFLVAPKFSLIPDKLAITAQTGMVLISGEGSDNAWLTMPGVVFTHSFSPMFDITVNPKLVLTFADDFDESNFAVGTNLGFRLAPEGQRWSIMPEIGFLYDDDAADEDASGGYFLQIGLGFSWQLGDMGTRAAPPPAQTAPPPPMQTAPPPPPPTMPPPGPAPGGPGPGAPPPPPPPPPMGPQPTPPI